MESEEYLEGSLIVKPPYFENISFLDRKIVFENFVKSIDIDLWYIISFGDFQPTKTIFDKEDKTIKEC